MPAGQGAQAHTQSVEVEEDPTGQLHGTMAGGVVHDPQLQAQLLGTMHSAVEPALVARTQVGHEGQQTFSHCETAVHVPAAWPELGTEQVNAPANEPKYVPMLQAVELTTAMDASICMASKTDTDSEDSVSTACALTEASLVMARDASAPIRAVTDDAEMLSELSVVMSS